MEKPEIRPFATPKHLNEAIAFLMTRQQNKYRMLVSGNGEINCNRCITHWRRRSKIISPLTFIFPWILKVLGKYEGFVNKRPQALWYAAGCNISRHCLLEEEEEE